LLNMGNFILSNNIAHDVSFDVEMLSKTVSCDVTYFYSLILDQLNGCQLHVVENLEYEHCIHDDGLQIKYSAECNGTLWDHLVPYFRDAR
jgi:hypothetical protein